MIYGKVKVKKEGGLVQSGTWDDRVGLFFKVRLLY